MLQSFVVYTPILRYLFSWSDNNDLEVEPLLYAIDKIKSNDERRRFWERLHRGHVAWENDYIIEAPESEID